MIVNVIKTSKDGLWAIRGVNVVRVDVGDGQDLHQDLANELILAGWAVKPKEKKEVVEATKPVEEKAKQEDTDNSAVETVEKKKLGWWHVKFEGREDVVKVRGADNDDEAVKKAIEEVEAGIDG